MGGASAISPQPQGSWNSGATHLATEPCAHTQGRGGGGVRAAGLPGPSRSRRSPAPRLPPPAPRAGGRPSGAAGNWRTSCRFDLRLSWSPRPGSPAGNDTASSPASALTPRGARGAGPRSLRRAGGRPARGRRAAPPARRAASPRGGSGQAGCASRRVVRPVSDGSGSARGVGAPRGRHQNLGWAEGATAPGKHRRLPPRSDLARRTPRGLRRLHEKWAGRPLGGPRRLDREGARRPLGGLRRRDERGGRGGN